jgi:3-mercaptopyruvate sulfurtransferase SseA
MTADESSRAGLTYDQLVDKLAESGVTEKEAVIRNKLAPGKFSAAFMVQCLEAIGVKQLRI